MTQAVKMRRMRFDSSKMLSFALNSLKFVLRDNVIEAKIKLKNKSQENENLNLNYKRITLDKNDHFRDWVWGILTIF